MRKRQINFLRHPMSGRQALLIALECWKEDRRIPVFIIAPPGETEDKVSAIRVALSRERKETKRKYRFTIHAGEAFKYTDEGEVGEACVLRYTVSTSQHIANNMSFGGFNGN